MHRLVSLVGTLALAVASEAGAFTPWPGDDLSLQPSQVWVLGTDAPHRDAGSAQHGLLTVNLSDDWAPFILSDNDGPGTPSKPNGYRPSFIRLANDQVNQDELFLESDTGRRAVLSRVPAALRSGDDKLTTAEQQALERARQEVDSRRGPNFLEPYGIPPTLSVLATRVAADVGKTCYAAVDVASIKPLDFEIGYQTREQAKRDLEDTLSDEAWVAERIATLQIVVDNPDPAAVVAKIAAADPTTDPARADRYVRGEKRVKAIRAVQARLVCEGMLDAERMTPGLFDHATHTALANFEKKNDIFGWGFVSGETQTALVRDPMQLHLETFHRILAERISDAAGIVEDGSVANGSDPATYVDEAGVKQPVPDLIGQYTAALEQALGVQTPQDLVAFLQTVGPQSKVGLRVAYQAPPLPPYYSPLMTLSAEIDRGDIWYDVPYDAAGRPLAQRRKRFPHFTLYTTWRGQKIPLVHWRTTIGSWRSELAKDGHIYLAYKNSDVGPRIWKNIVAAPAWLPPDTTLAKDLLVKKLFDRRIGYTSVVNTEVMGPGYGSAYGLVMAIHLKEMENGGLFDNKIRTHGSVDYTSIARRFSHGCHRLVNNRAVRLFDFVLHHSKFSRLGDYKLTDFKRKLHYEGRTYEYRLNSRGYYYELKNPIPVMVLEGRVLGAVKTPIRALIRKPGENYAPVPADVPVEAQPVAGP